MKVIVKVKIDIDIDEIDNDDILSNINDILSDSDSD